jgi:dipeptidyl aminopeptidase/acylaminoacyl peptidase
LLVSGEFGRQEKLLGIWTVSVVTGQLHQLREDAFQAKASPDGSQIAYVDSKRRQIWLMGNNGENPSCLLAAEKGASFGHLEFSPDGRRLIYTKSREGSDVSAIEAFDLKNGYTTTVFTAPDLGDFCWTPDGRIIYDRPEATPNQSYRNFWEIKTDPKTGKAIGNPFRLTNWAGFKGFESFNLSANGKRFAFTKVHWENSDVYVAELKKNAIRLQPPRRLTLDERWDADASWSKDSQSIYFASNRKGSFDIFRQGIHEITAQEAVTGPEDETSPQLSPDALWLLYLASPRMPDGSPAKRCGLMRMPVEGGPGQTVFNLGQPDQDTFGFRCPAQSGKPCVLSETDPAKEQIVFSTFEPATAHKREIARIAREPEYGFSWDLSLDGSRIAYCRNEMDSFKINVLGLASGATREIPLKGWTQCIFLAWSTDGKGWFAGSNLGPMLYIAASGEAHFLQKAPKWYNSARPSPDGRYLAYTQTTAESNAWMVDNLP